jgi:hypothetical protein
MRTTTRQTPQQRRNRRPAHVAPRPAAVRQTAEARVRAEGGPRDIALYSCACGCAFDGAVSTHVACPQCGGEQAW